MLHDLPHAAENQHCIKLKYGEWEVIILYEEQAVSQLYRTGTNLYNRVNNNSRLKKDRSRLLFRFSITICR